MASTTIITAYDYCERFARSHTEFFPIASFLLPAKLRRSISVIYTFARQSDDMADEGDLSTTKRIEKLNHFWHSLETIGSPTEPLFIALAEVLNQNPQLPIQLFFDLLTAFKQDVTKSDYKNTQEVLQYAQLSANPVGRLLLHLTHNDTTKNLQYSDAICTSLQLINFLRDIEPDLRLRNRCYLPLDKMQQHNITLEDLREQKKPSLLQSFVQEQLHEASILLQQGTHLGNTLTGFFGFEIRLIIKHNQHMIKKLKSRKNVYECPKIYAWDWINLFIQTAVESTYVKKTQKTL